MDKLADEEEREITGEDLLLDNVTEIPCLVEPILQQVGLACLAGSSDTGKSSIFKAICIATGEPDFIGFKINAKHQSVIFVPTEDYRIATSFLLKRQISLQQPAQLKGLRYVFDHTDLLKPCTKD